MKNTILKNKLFSSEFKSFTSNYKLSIYFILMNVFVAFLGFLRSFIFIKLLNFEQLGIITIVQTTAALFGFLQLGLINGGYRIVAVNSSTRTSKRIVNIIFSYISIISILLIFFSILTFDLNLIISDKYLIMTVLLAIFTLVCTWLTNYLIACRKYSFLNKVNLFSSLFGFFILFLIYYIEIYGAILSLVLQPLIFIILVLVKNKDSRPSKFLINIKLLRYILSFGFIPFLSGIFFLLYVQIERWSINLFISTEALGEAYLYFIIIALWVLVPNSLMSIFFPRSSKKFSDNDLLSMNNMVKVYFITVFIYCVISSLSVFYLLKPIVSLLFETHLPYSYLVLMSLPGLIFRTLSDPFTLFFNSTLNFKSIFLTEVLGLLLYSIFIAYVNYYYDFKLIHVVFLFDLYFTIKFFFFLIFYYISPYRKDFLLN